MARARVARGWISATMETRGIRGSHTGQPESWLDRRDWSTSRVDVVTLTLTAGAETVPDMRFYYNSMDMRPERRDVDGWGTSVELAGVVQLLDAVAAGDLEITDMRRALVRVANELERRSLTDTSDGLSRRTPVPPNRPRPPDTGHCRGRAGVVSGARIHPARTVDPGRCRGRGRGSIDLHGAPPPDRQRYHVNNNRIRLTGRGSECPVTTPGRLGSPQRQRRRR